MDPATKKKVYVGVGVATLGVVGGGLIGMLFLVLLAAMPIAACEVLDDAPVVSWFVDCEQEWTTHLASTETCDTPVSENSGETYATLSEEQRANAQIIIDTGIEVGIPEYGLIIAIATAMQESRLRNLDHGDRDSLGLFQQREASGWGGREITMDPVLSSKAFYGGATSPHWRAPSNTTSPRGLQDIPGWASMEVTEAAQEVQVSGFPDAYAQWEGLAREAVGELGGGVGGGDLCGPGTAMNCPETEHAAEQGLTPDALRVIRCLSQEYPEITTYHGVGGRSGASDHPSGRAVDAMIPDYASSEGNAYGWEVAEWLKANAAGLGVKYLIWDEKIWSPERDAEGWREYTRYDDQPNDDTLQHRDHVHISVYGDAAGQGDDAGEWTVPIRGDYTVGSTYGEIGPHWSSGHTGTDLMAPTGTPILAAAEGEVTTVADLGGESYGRYVVIKHASGVESWYAHMSEIAVAQNDPVTPGTVIGYVGATGNVTGPHLHFEIRQSGRTTDPENWMSEHAAPL